jgi:hypothetical protein
MQQLYVTGKGKVAYRPVTDEGNNFAKLIEDYYHRYRVPVIVTETSAYGPENARLDWFERSTRMIRDLRSRGIPVLGYTWFPMFTMIDWRYRFGRGPLEKYYMELGLFKLGRTRDSGRWERTPLAERIRDCILDPKPYVGELSPSQESVPSNRGEKAGGF